MNVADSQRLASHLERLGYRWTDRIHEADLIVVNSCAVRQQAEDRVDGRLNWLAGLKRRRPQVLIALTGCLVTPRTIARLREKYPHVDLFLRPAEMAPLVQELEARLGETIPGIARPATRPAELPDPLTAGPLTLPEHERGRLVSAFVPVIYGCNMACTYCVVPSRRGPERSRPADRIEAHVRSLVEQGVREVTLLGQIVDRYGWDRGEPDALEQLLRRLNRVEGLARIRFLTSHPSFLSERLLRAVAELDRVMEHIEVPVQSGSDEILRRMRRRYAVDDYRRLVERIRCLMPQAAIHTDIIVGFPGETERDFQASYELLAELRLDKAHVARYSPRPGTPAAQLWTDDVPAAEKERRRKALDDLQATISRERNELLLGRAVQILVEGRKGPRWYGRTRTNRLVFFESPECLTGQEVDIVVDWAGPWSLVGHLAGQGDRA